MYFNFVAVTMNIITRSAVLIFYLNPALSFSPSDYADVSFSTNFSVSHFFSGTKF